MTNGHTDPYTHRVLETLHAAARGALAGDPVRPLYLRLAEALSPHVAEAGGELPSARRLAGELGLNRATVTAAYRELSRQGLLVLRPGRPRRGGYGQPAPARAASSVWAHRPGALRP